VNERDREGVIRYCMDTKWVAVFEDLYVAGIQSYNP
jgi:hypothetical protein